MKSANILQLQLQCFFVTCYIGWSLVCCQPHFSSEFHSNDINFHDQIKRYENRISDPLEFFHRWANNKNPPVFLNEKQSAWWYSLGDYRPRNRRSDPPYPQPVYRHVPYEYPPYTPYMVNQGGSGRFQNQKRPNRHNWSNRSHNRRGSQRRHRSQGDRESIRGRQVRSESSVNPSWSTVLGNRFSTNVDRSRDHRNNRDWSDNRSNRDGFDSRRRGQRANSQCDEIPGPMRTRREYRVMTPAMREQFVSAVLALANYCPDGCTPCNTDRCISAYDIFVELHQVWQSPGAHGGASFYPWHREYLWRFENALMRHGNYPEDLGLPYWDSILDSSLPNPADSVLWTQEYVGNNKGILGAPFGTITVPEFCGFTVDRDVIDVPNNGTFNSFLFQEENIRDIMSLDCFAHLTQNPALTCTGGVPCNFEDKHGGPHIWVGGDMGTFCSPSDPIFWMHHGFIDYIWEIHRQQRQTSNIEREYPQSSFGGEQAAWNSPMAPFPGLINAHGLSSHYTAYYYDYFPRPSGIRCNRDSQCNPLDNNNSALWCDRRFRQCRSKIRVGGLCANLPHNACWCPASNQTPRCNGGTCSCE